MLLISSTLFLPLIANADIAPDPGTHEYSTHAVFDNIADYPSFDVYASNYRRFGPTPIIANDAIEPRAEQIQSNGHPASTLAPFFAVRKSNQSLIVHKDDPYGEQGDIWGTLPENKQYMVNATVTGEGESLKNELVSGNLPDSNPAVYIVWVYHIDNLTDTSFTAHFVSESRYDADVNLVYGSALPKTLASASTPTSATESSTTVVPSETSNTPWTTIWIVISGLGLIIILLAYKAWKK